MPKDREMIRTNVMIDKRLLEEIDNFAQFNEEDRSTAIRQLLKRSLAEEKIVLAVRKFQEGIPFRKAAGMSGLDYWEFQSELDKRNIPVSSSLSFARKRLQQGR